uniref:Uncharacterized protein n=1 Tax=Anguilla anguilla TaxID=7936 RepID=A0A0E9VQS7_ANGAN
MCTSAPVPATVQPVGHQEFRNICKYQKYPSMHKKYTWANWEKIIKNLGFRLWLEWKPAYTGVPRSEVGNH